MRSADSSGDQSRGAVGTGSEVGAHDHGGSDGGQPQWTHVMIKGPEPRTSSVMLGVLRRERDQTIGKVLKPAWRSGPVVILPAFVAARPRAGLAGPPPGPPEPTPPTRAWWHPAAAVGGPPGCRRGGHPRRAVVPPRRASGRHLQDRGRRQYGPAARPAGGAGVLPARRQLHHHPGRPALLAFRYGPHRRGGVPCRAGGPGAATPRLGQ